MIIQNQTILVESDAERDAIIRMLGGKTEDDVQNENDCRRWWQKGFEHGVRVRERWNLIEEGNTIPDKWLLGIFKDKSGWVNPVPYVCRRAYETMKAWSTQDGWIVRGNDKEYYKDLTCVAWIEMPEWREDE